MRRRLSHWEVLPPTVFAAFVASCWLRDYLPNPRHELHLAVVLLGLAVLTAGVFVSLWNRTIPKRVEPFLFDYRLAFGVDVFGMLDVTSRVSCVTTSPTISAATGATFISPSRARTSAVRPG